MILAHLAFPIAGSEGNIVEMSIGRSAIIGTAIALVISFTGLGFHQIRLLYIDSCIATALEAGKEHLKQWVLL